MTRKVVATVQGAGRYSAELSSSTPTSLFRRLPVSPPEFHHLSDTDIRSVKLIFHWSPESSEAYNLQQASSTHRLVRYLDVAAVEGFKSA